MNDLQPAIDFIFNTLMMSSLEIAELTGKMHKNVIRDQINDGSDLSHEDYQEVTDNRGYCAQILLGKIYSLGIASGYSFPLRMKIINRWQELEGANNKPMGRVELAQENLRLTIREVELENEVKALEVVLDKSKEYSSIKLQESIAGKKFKWQDLKKASLDNGLEIKRVFDQNYRNVNSYSAEAWPSTYNVEI